ncbi:MAG: universal stress protein [Parachlamydiaceae bacterium]|nr:universal stress protein [Parachlamydiaceae bacterium]
MYKKILVALENSIADKTLLPHITQLAQIHHSHLLLLHVADGWVARHFNELMLKESDEMIQDRKYLEETAEKLRKKGLKVTTHLALGNPPEEILKVGEEQRCDLIAMTSHGHRFFADFLFGSTIEEVRHQSEIPLLVVKWSKK